MAMELHMDIMVVLSMIYIVINVDAGFHLERMIQFITQIMTPNKMQLMHGIHGIKRKNLMLHVKNARIMGGICHSVENVVRQIISNGFNREELHLEVYYKYYI
jgi:hypothetical protein